MYILQHLNFFLKCIQNFLFVLVFSSQQQVTVGWAATLKKYLRILKEQQIFIIRKKYYARNIILHQKKTSKKGLKEAFTTLKIEWGREEVSRDFFSQMQKKILKGLIFCRFLVWICFTSFGVCLSTQNRRTKTGTNLDIRQ